MADILSRRMVSRMHIFSISSREIKLNTSHQQVLYNSIPSFGLVDSFGIWNPNAFSEPSVTFASLDCSGRTSDERNGTAVDAKRALYLDECHSLKGILCDLAVVARNDLNAFHKKTAASKSNLTYSRRHFRTNRPRKEVVKIGLLCFIWSGGVFRGTT